MDNVAVADEAGTDSETVREVVERIDRNLLSTLESAKAVSHPGESGRAREDAVRNALIEFLPNGYRASTGFVIDAVGGISRQIDVVIQRDGYHPRLQVGNLEFFMVESVAAVIEVKASMASLEKLTSALTNIASVKELDRTNRGHNYEVHGSMKGASIDRDKFGHQVYGVLITEESLRWERLLEVVGEHLEEAERRTWPNLYVDVMGLVGGYEDGGGWSDNPMNASHWQLLFYRHRNRYPLMGWHRQRLLP